MASRHRILQGIQTWPGWQWVLAPTGLPVSYVVFLVLLGILYEPQHRHSTWR